MNTVSPVGVRTNNPNQGKEVESYAHYFVVETSDADKKALEKYGMTASSLAFANTFIVAFAVAVVALIIGVLTGNVHAHTNLVAKPCLRDLPAQIGVR